MYIPKIYFMREDDNTPQVTYDGSGLCLSINTCVITCKNAKSDEANIVPVPYSVGVSERVCVDKPLGCVRVLATYFPSK